MQEEEFLELRNEDPNEQVPLLWQVSLHGIFHSDFFFDSFPNDRQRLQIKFRADNCGYKFVPSASGKSFSWEGNKPGGKGSDKIGDDTSGWEIEDVIVETWYAPFTNLYVKTNTNNPKDPFFSTLGILEPRSDEQLNAEYELCEGNYTSLCGVSCSHGFTITVTVKRKWSNGDTLSCNQWNAYISVPS